MTFGRHEEQVFLGRDIAHQKDYSEHTAIEIDREVRRIIDKAYQKAHSLLSGNMPLLQALAEFGPTRQRRYNDHQYSDNQPTRHTSVPLPQQHMRCHRALTNNRKVIAGMNAYSTEQRARIYERCWNSKWNRHSCLYGSSSDHPF